MTAADYVELRCRSAFSFLAGASLPEDLVERAAALGYDVLALADRGGVYGAPRFFQAARRARRLADLAAAHRVPVVATNDVRHAAPEGRPLLDVLTCIRLGTTLDQAGRRLLANVERHLKPPAEMAALFRDMPDAIRQSRRIAERCAFTLADLGYRFPEFPLAPGETPIGHLRALTYAGARDRYRTITPAVQRQLEHELGMIERLDLAGYFLIVWDIVRFCRERRILCQGRGSAANSAVCYALGITAVDPVGMGLLFERFLSEERGEWPDIDLDLPSGDRREEVIQYVYRRYGERGAAMTATVISYRARSAVREAGKALGLSLEQVDRLAKLLRAHGYSDEHDELGAQLRAGGVDPEAPRIGLLVEIVRQMQGLPRHLGQHTGGMVIAAGRLDEVVEVAIIRPGPIVGQMVNPYLKRRAGREPVGYAHPSLEPILACTLGVPLFQEQLLRIAMTVAGFTGGEAEELRRAMGFKRSEARMRAIEARLRAGMAARGITGAAQDEIVRQITSFALYGFPECVGGDTRVIDADTGRHVSIEEVATGRVQLTTTLACDADLQLRPRRVLEALASGKRMVYRLRTALGREITATAEHPFLTVNGWRTLAELHEGDHVATALSQGAGLAARTVCSPDISKRGYRRWVIARLAQ